MYIEKERFGQENVINKGPTVGLFHHFFICDQRTTLQSKNKQQYGFYTSQTSYNEQLHNDNV